MRDREREVQAKREAAERQMSLERNKLRREEELNNFLALLAEHVHSPKVRIPKIKISITFMAFVIKMGFLDSKLISFLGVVASGKNRHVT